MEILLGIILFIVLLYYGLRLFLRYLLPWLLQRFVKRQESKFRNYYQQQAARNQQDREGDVKVKKDGARKPKDDKDFGEYVDFEDVDE